MANRSILRGAITAAARRDRRNSGLPFRSRRFRLGPSLASARSSYRGAKLIFSNKDAHAAEPRRSVDVFQRFASTERGGYNSIAVAAPRRATRIWFQKFER